MIITRKNNLLYVDEWPKCLDKECSFTRRTKQTKWPFKIVYTKEKLFVLNEDGSAFVHCGLFNRITRMLDMCGQKYTVRDLRPPLTVPDLSKVDNLREKQDVVLATICASHGGVIKCPTGWGKSWLICQLTRMYTGAKILVLTPRRPVALSIYKRLCDANDEHKLGIKISVMCAGKRFLEDSNIIVCTTGSIHKICSEWPTLIICDEVHGIGTERLRAELMNFAASRLFGFSATPEGRHDNADMVIEALFGEIICNIAYKAAQTDGTVPPIQVRLVRVVGDPVVYTSDVDKERKGYWQNGLRNEQIAAVANCEEFAGKQMLILVKTVEHALILKNLLPDFELVYGGINKNRVSKFLQDGILDIQKYNTEEAQAEYTQYMKDWLEDQNEGKPAMLGYLEFLVNKVHSEIGSMDISDMEEKFKSGEVQRVIATTVWREGVDFPDLPVNIRADGMSGVIASLQMAGRLCRISENQKILIDFTDEFGDNYRDRAVTRISHYKAQGWEIINDWRA